MGTLSSSPGVLCAAEVTYITAADVMELIGCKDNKAYEIIRGINKAAIEKGMFAYGQGKASKYIFAQKFGIPMEVINSVINSNRT